MTAPVKPFDPLAIIESLERHRVAYVLIGELAGVIHGTDEIANSVDICPQMKADNLERLGKALKTLDARTSDGGPAAVDGTALAGHAAVALGSPAGDITIVPQPDGTTGYDDLRRKATREPLGGGVRASVARVDDLARIISAAGATHDADRLSALRHIAERELGRGVGR